MKTVSLIARFLLGAMFVVFGLNGFFHFIPQPPPSPGLPMQFLGALSESHFLAPVFALQLVSGVLLLSNFYVPIALVLLGPVLVNILLYHALMEPKTIGPGVFATILWLLVFYGVRLVFQPILVSRVKA